LRKERKRKEYAFSPGKVGVGRTFFINARDLSKGGGKREIPGVQHTASAEEKRKKSHTYLSKRKEGEKSQTLHIVRGGREGELKGETFSTLLGKKKDEGGTLARGGSNLFDCEEGK